jgi:hypothetical protein
MKRFILPGIAVAIWLFFWANDTGVLVASFADAGYPGRRVCHYVIGLSVVTRYSVPAYGDPNAERCPLLKRV